MQEETTTRHTPCHQRLASSHRLYGTSIPEHGWVPSPSYLLRRARILEHLDSLTPGNVLEIGCGAGGLIEDFLERGFRYWGVDDSPAALEILHEVYSSRTQVQVFGSLSELPKTVTSASGQRELFDLIVAFEVLEHIEHDREALNSWLSYLKPDGEVLLSVPAHRARWNATDEWAGHFRRYDRADFELLLAECGLEVTELECYGFPLGNIVEPIRAHLKRRLVARATSLQQSSGASEPEALAERTARSGTERGFEMKLYPYLCSRLGTSVMQASFWVQKQFRSSGLGVGFVVRARRLTK